MTIVIDTFFNLFLFYFRFAPNFNIHAAVCI